MGFWRKTEYRETFSLPLETPQIVDFARNLVNTKAMRRRFEETFRVKTVLYTEADKTSLVIQSEKYRWDFISAGFSHLCCLYHSKGSVTEGDLEKTLLILTHADMKLMIMTSSGPKEVPDHRTLSEKFNAMNIFGREPCDRDSKCLLKKASPILPAPSRRYSGGGGSNTGPR
jgi:hypothetical protein